MPFSHPLEATPPTFTRRRAIAVLAGAFSAQVFAQSDRAIRVIVPSSAGSATDVTARAAQTGLSSALGVPVVVENIVGASGLVGLQALARAAPDGNTLVVITNNVVIAPAVMRAFPFDVAKDFTPIAMVGTIPFVLVANSAKVAATNSKEFAALLKSKPDGLNYGSSGIGSTYHLANELFLSEVGAKAQHVPYQGPNPMLAGLLGGQVDFGTLAVSLVQPHIQSGALRAIGMFSAARVSMAPEIPTFVEQGLPNCIAEAWVTVLGPKGMAPTTVQRIHNAVSAAYNSPSARDSLTKQGTLVSVSTHEEAQIAIRRDLAMYASLAKKIGLEPQ